jgi:UDP-glucose 4-epimerase
LRYFNVAGADPEGRAGQRGPRSTHLIRVAIETALGRRPALQVFGDDYGTRDGSCERDFIHVSDLAAAHVSALRYLQAGGSPDVFNCGYGRGYTVFEVIACLEALLGRKLPVEVTARRPGDPARLISNAGRIRERLDWAPQRGDLEQILADALAWQTGLAASTSLNLIEAGSS